MGVTSIQDAKVLISSNLVKDRTQGLKELANILRHNIGKPVVEAISNKAYLALCDTLFDCMRAERDSLLRSKAKTPKGSSNLVLGASALRLVVNTGVRTFKSATVEHIIGTIIALLPGRDDSLLAPLRGDLPKAMRSLLEYQPHVERLSQESWDATVDFCLATLATLFSEPDAEPHESFSTTLSRGERSRTRTPFDSAAELTASKLGSRELPVRASISEAFVQIAEDLMHCLQLLTKASNAPVLGRAEPILAMVVHILQRRAGRSHPPALATANNLLAHIKLHDTRLTKNTIRDLLPVMKSLWGDNALRDDLLVTLMHTEAHIASILCEDHAETPSSDVEFLVDALYNDYKRRKENVTLQFLEDEHLCFRQIGDPTPNTHPLNTHTFSLESGDVRYESLWTLVSSIARFSYMLDHRKRVVPQNHVDEEEDGRASTKRLRKTYHFDDYLRHVSDPSSSAKRAALQVLAFMLQEGPLKEEDIQAALERLIPFVSSENPAHSSWAMLALTAAAFQQCSKSSNLQSSWVSAWQGASRAVTSASTSRAACHLMDVLIRLEIVPFSAVSAIVQSMLSSIELNGPALVTDSSSSFLRTVIQQRISENPAHFNQTAERVLSWLLSKWTPSLWPERSYSCIAAHHCAPADVLRLLYSCLDRPFDLVNPAPFLNLGPFAQVRVHAALHCEFERYLLLLPEQQPFQLPLSSFPKSSTSSNPEWFPTQIQDRSLSYCFSELERSRQRWKEWTKQNAHGITADMLRIIITHCVVASALLEFPGADQRRKQSLETAVDSFIDSFVTFLTKRETEQYKVDAVLEIITKTLPDIRQLKRLSPLSFKRAGVYSLASHLSNALDSREELKHSFHADDDDDFMDVDNAPGSQPVRGSFNADIDVPRHDIQAQHDAAALRANCSAYCHLISYVLEDAREGYGDIPQGFVDYVTSVSEAELLRFRAFMKRMLSTRLRLRKSSCIQLIGHLSERLLDPIAREYNTSEVVHGMVLDVMVGVVPDLDAGSTDSESQELYDMTADLYGYYVKDMEKGGVRRSPSVQASLATLLHRLFRQRLDFGGHRTAPSVRTSLFQLLAEGEIAVKYHISKSLPEIFEYFILPEHEKILEDIVQNLPSDVAWYEGLAVSLLVLAGLASHWYTLLRQGIYRIFSAAGSNGAVTEYAKKCIERIATARNLDSPQDLFRLFAPQIIFTWLDRKLKYATLPFASFAYPSLEALLQDVEAEVVAQAIMLGRKEEVEYVAQCLGASTAEVLVRNFGKAAAYTISWDTCKGSARNKGIESNGLLLRELIGAENYGKLIQSHFPRVLGYILQTTDHEERINKLLDKRPAYAETAKALREISSFSHSEQNFDLGIEPSFNAYYLIDQIERLCRRTNFEIATSWYPDKYTFMMRMLLDRLHPAMGSLHARSVIRKVRILVSLAGKVAYNGYPLQMTLQSLRPFLTDIQCAEDTFGIVQYLFEHGAGYLRDHHNFVTGIGLSILISTRVFLGSSQESTTQESQYTTAMSKAQRFHAWLVQYLKTYAGQLEGRVPASSIKAFKEITTAAAGIRTQGNSFKNSEEAKLLVGILEDVRSDRKLLNNTSREVALDLLCKDFRPAPSARDDILETDSQIAEYAPQVWDSCFRSNVGDGYLLWAARILGRAFSASGEVKRKVKQARPWTVEPRSSRDSLGRPSRDAIIRKIEDVFYSDDRKEVGLAESAIRQLLSLTTDHDYVRELNIPLYIGEAFTSQLPIPLDHNEAAPHAETVEQAVSPSTKKPVAVWIRDLAVKLCRVTEEPILGSIPKLLLGIDGIAEALFPYILHLVLLEEYEADQVIRGTLSDAVMDWFSGCNELTSSYVRILLQAILYLRSQPVPKEVTRVDRDKWLEIDHMKAAEAAATCGMYRSALLFAETASGQPVVKTTSRRSSVKLQPPIIPIDLQLSIYKNLDEPDSFYGVERGFSLASVVERLDHEKNGIKGLLFRGARLDGQIRSAKASDPTELDGLMQSMVSQNLNSITHSLISTDQYRDTSDDMVDTTLHTARKLAQWDIKAPEGKHSESVTLFKAFQGLQYASDALDAREHLDEQMLATMRVLSTSDKSSSQSKSVLRTLAVLAEADEVVSTPNREQLLELWEQMKRRESWMSAGEYEDVRLLLSCRETLFGVLSSNPHLQDSLHLLTNAVRNMEVEALVQSSTLGRRHGALQESLASVSYLNEIVQQCKSVGLDVEATASFETANVLWDQGEAETSIRMRQHLAETVEFDSQKIDISQPVLLAKLGHHIAEARLAQPDTIIKEYLEPAIQELKGESRGPGAGQVFHEFAFFCDKQLQSPEAAADLARMKTVMERKQQEFEEFRKLAKSEQNKGLRDTYKRSAHRAGTWFKLDKAEYDRLQHAREQILRQCLENYLLSLQASDEFDNDALRVFSLWLEFSDSALANDAVKLYLSKVPSGKFALLMNQLSSRLQAENTDFQLLLSELVYRICVDHPYHGMYQLFAIQMKVSSPTGQESLRSKDESSKSRQRAAIAIAKSLRDNKRASKYWSKIYNSAELYHVLAMFKDDSEKHRSELSLDRYPQSKALNQRIPDMHVPPATLQIEVRPNCDYSDLPVITHWKTRMSIANGLSAPKVITAIGSDGKPYKQLFKSGNDDLRQDAIMEQVFDQVSRLLKHHTATRLRNLGIRTYKVLPLSTRSGLMEFVMNTVPLNTWLMPAHERYYPSDYKPDRCRKDIAACQGDSLNTRVKVWQKVADNFHPVLRYFFTEHFLDPDEWFEKRLAYTRSTAAISILGHVLGLGDRHCHNILLDEKTGEVVHIDLGVSFEAGRVLPVPEVVPFRLTRDLVDAMGYTKTEGVFRRCCEFTMDTLREERESIMTLLNVLRYDPLVNWSVTPAKAKRMQENQDASTNARGGPGANTPAPTTGGGGGGAIAGPAGSVLGLGLGDDPAAIQESGVNRKRDEQAGEAGRALSVVEKKLSKTLSTNATVNELIQQATEERNLAVLYCGWASYA